ncbi:MAG: DUF192 domain-containing protein [Rectinemataceae bacterium]
MRKRETECRGAEGRCRSNSTLRRGAVRGLRCAALAALLFSTGCASKSADSAAGIDRPNPPLRTAVFRVGPATIKAEIARSEIERERGLMYRQTLPDGTGMLFVFDSDQHLSFWMKNTFLPLSLAYIASDGIISQMVDLSPQSLDPRQSERSVRYALEVPQGWFDRAGVKVGDRVEIPRTD